MNLRHLQCFLVLAEELHFGKAAERLFIAQPPLSRIVKELEQELGVVLFKRTRRSVILTKAGDFLRMETQKLFLQIDFIKTQLPAVQSGKSRKIKIGYVGAAMHSVLPGILLDLRTNFDIQMVLLELKNEEQAIALNTGQIDIGFVRSVPEHTTIQSHEIFRETLSLIISKNHPLASKSRISLIDVANEPFIGLTYDCAPNLCDKITRICEQSGFHPKIEHETSQMNSIVRLVECGMGYSLVPTSVKSAYALNVRFIEQKKCKERAQLFLMYKKEMPELVNNCVKLIINMNKLKKLK